MLQPLCHCWLTVWTTTHWAVFDCGVLCSQHMLGLDSVVVVFSLYCFFFPLGKLVLFFIVACQIIVSEDWAMLCYALFKTLLSKAYDFHISALRWFRCGYCETSGFSWFSAPSSSSRLHQFFKNQKGMKRKEKGCDCRNETCIWCLGASSVVEPIQEAQLHFSAQRQAHSPAEKAAPPPQRRLVEAQEVIRQQRRGAAEAFIPCRKCAGWKDEGERKEKKEKKNVEFWRQLWKKVFGHPSNVNEEVVI